MRDKNDNEDDEPKAKKKRNETMSDEQLDIFLQNSENKNTRKQNEKTIRNFTEFLTESGEEDTNFLYFDGKYINARIEQYMSIT